MCGIWAFLETQINRTGKINDSEEKAKEKAKAIYEDFLQLTHRGPDHSHYEVLPSSGLSLGFHRLAIVDLSISVNQPLKYEDGLGTVILLCNGEIYNYKELIEELPWIRPFRMIVLFYWNCIGSC